MDSKPATTVLLLRSSVKLAGLDYLIRISMAGALLAGLGACSVAPRSADPAAPDRRSAAPAEPALQQPQRDGPGANPPADLANVPDAEPRVETIRPGGPNKPYEALGQTYIPQTQDLPFRQRGMASWYGRKFHGRRTASGEPYDMYAMTAAHPTLPLPSYVRVRNPANGAEVVLRINDRGPFHAGRIIDLSYTAAVKLSVAGGVAPVELERITFDDIRSGAWRRNGAPPTSLAQAAPAAAKAPKAVAAVPAPAPVPTPMPALASGVATLPPEPAAQMPATAAAIESSAAPALAATPTPPPIAATQPAPAAAPPTGFWVQLGAFQQRSGAEGFHRRVAADVDWLAPLLAVFSEPPVHRLQAGPYASRDEAQGVAQRVREALKLVPVVLERR